jgi:DNA-binding transcriptional ArsR family regulator
MPHLLFVPGPVNVKVALEPVYNNLSSLYMVALAGGASGLDPWVYATAAALSAEQKHTHRLLFDILYSAFEPDEAWPTFPAYLDHLAEIEPKAMHNRFLRHMFPHAAEAYLQSDRLMELDAFIEQIDRSEFDQEIEAELFAGAHNLLNDPPALRALILSHLTLMWHEFLAEEWQRNQKLLRAVRGTYRNQSYSGLNAYDAIEAVTGRDMRGHWQKLLAPAETLIFIPSPHLGPGLMNIVYGNEVRIVFGARLSRGQAQAPVELTRADLLVQLRTLADDTRLRILELLLEAGELYAQELISRLKLTKSSASRHLSQLSAAGYLIERQQAGKAKSYSLNPERFQETLRFIEHYTQS